MPIIDDYISSLNDWGSDNFAGSAAEKASDYWSDGSSNEVTDPKSVDNSWMGGVNASGGNSFNGWNTPIKGNTVNNLGYKNPTQDRSQLISQQNDAALQAKIADIRNAIAKVKSTYNTQRTSDLNTVQQTRNNIVTNSDNAINTIRGQISSLSPQYDALKAQANQNYQSGVQTQQNLINRASETYRPLLNQVSAGRAQLTRQALEQAANVGDNGGVGRQQQLQISTAAENDINKLSTDKQNYVNDANSKINDIANAYKVSIANLDAGQQSALNELSGKIANIESDRNTNLTNADLQVQAIEQKYSQAIAEAERSGSAEEVVANETARAAEIAAIRNEWDRLDKAAAQASKNALDEASQILANKINSAKLEEAVNPESNSNKLAAAQAAAAQANLENLPNKFAQESQLNQAQINSLNKKSEKEDTTGKLTAKDIVSKIISMKNMKQPGDPYSPMYSDTDILNFVESSGLSDSEILQVLNQFGIDLNSMR